jgi:hypothetical protein
MRGNHKIPDRGDQVEQRRMGVSRVGVVWYADQLQVLVKWHDGKSSSLRLGRDQFSIRTADDGDARSSNETRETPRSARPEMTRVKLRSAYYSKNSRSAHSGQ